MIGSRGLVPPSGRNGQKDGFCTGLEVVDGYLRQAGVQWHIKAMETISRPACKIKWTEVWQSNVNKLHWKHEIGGPTPFCADCNKEAWGPGHFYSTPHLLKMVTFPYDWCDDWGEPESAGHDYDGQRETFETLACEKLSSQAIGRSTGQKLLEFLQ